jgi:signal transduction histidine kinase
MVMGAQEKGEKHRRSIRHAMLRRAALSAVLVALVAAGGLIITFRLADFYRNQDFESRKVQATAAAAGLDYRDVVALKGSPEDLGTPAFEHLKAQLTRIKQTDRRIRFVYLMRPLGNDMVFLVDAEDPSSADYSPPGQIYYEAVPVEFKTFQGKRRADPLVLGPQRDRWGVWVSAEAYVLDRNGQPTAFLGTDMDVRNALGTFDRIRYVGVLVVAITAFMLALVLGQWTYWRRNRDLRDARRAEMEESVVHLNEELVEADRQKSEFISVAAHDLRAPVTALEGVLSVMERSMEPQFGSTGRELIEMARHAASRLVNLARNLLDITRIEAGVSITPAKVDAFKLVAETALMFDATAREKGLDLRTDIPDGELPVVIDPEAVERVLENLIGNAVKYTESGTITVGVEPGHEVVRFRVGDTGRGIPKEMKGAVFERFSSLHRFTSSSERGAGLGLSICRSLVEAHGGRIWFESEEGKGTTFTFELPRVTSHKPGRPAAASG